MKVGLSSDWPVVSIETWDTCLKERVSVSIFSHFIEVVSGGCQSQGKCLHADLRSAQRPVSAVT